MHLPLVALLWVVVAFLGMAAFVILAMLLTQLSDQLGDARSNRRARKHDQAVRNDWKEKRQAVNDRFANATENADKAALRADAQYAALKNATIKCERATEALNAARAV